MARPLFQTTHRVRKGNRCKELAMSQLQAAQCSVMGSAAWPFFSALWLGFVHALAGLFRGRERTSSLPKRATMTLGRSEKPARPDPPRTAIRKPSGMNPERSAKQHAFSAAFRARKGFIIRIAGSGEQRPLNWY